ncbi:MAG: biopolymer transporter ExbD [Gammaproteobacteria bacterium]|nr:biopolymer transporter ExbD [Gammaproteobacteria bacterium]MCW8988206.1 biopolymer transporter ExbD [Gammaproteobacteria bacterium]MCW9032162.1 biopolymer transporter ExbD [Gammaproteobacteria bacterium]
MARRHHYRRKDKEVPELDITTFLNLMVVLIPFLLISAVFSRITILELDVPVGGAGQVDKPKLVLEVIVRKKGIEISNGKGVVANMPKVEDKYDIPQLSTYLQKIKKNYPDKTDAVVLMESELEYEFLVKVMDAVRSAEKKPEEEDLTETPAPVSNKPPEKIILFTNISVGDAP